MYRTSPGHRRRAGGRRRDADRRRRARPRRGPRPRRERPVRDPVDPETTARRERVDDRDDRQHDRPQAARHGARAARGARRASGAVAAEPPRGASRGVGAQRLELQTPAGARRSVRVTMRRTSSQALAATARWRSSATPGQAPARDQRRLPARVERALQPGGGRAGASASRAGQLRRSGRTLSLLVRNRGNTVDPVGGRVADHRRRRAARSGSDQRGADPARQARQRPARDAAAPAPRLLHGADHAAPARPHPADGHTPLPHRLSNAKGVRPL